MSATVARSTSILNEPGFEYSITFYGEVITGTPEQLRRIGIGLDVHFPEHANGHWRGKCTDPRGLEVKLRAAYCTGGRFFARIEKPGFEEYDDGVAAKPFAPGVDLRERWFDEYSGTADALVAAGIVPAGYFPGWPGMAKTTVNICPDGTLERTHNKAKEPGGKHVTCKSKGQRSTYVVRVMVALEIENARRQADKWRRDAWERRMNALPMPAPLIDLPGFRSMPKAKLVPEFRVDGNVIHLAPRSTWMAESCPA